MRGRRAGAGASAAVAVAVLLLGGCGAGGERDASAGSAAGKGDAAAPAAPAAAPSAAAAAPTAGAGITPVADNRLIAYTAQLALRTGDVAQVLAKARELATATGGYVSAESVSGATGGEGTAGGQLTLKIPSAAYQQTLDQLAALGEVVSRKSQADDLTQQVADVASRVQTQQASVERVRALMAQAKSLSEVTTLEAELSRREADLESLQKQQKELSARTSLSTVTLDVRREAASPTHAPAPPRDGGGFGASVGSALGGGWHVLVTVLRGLAVGIAAVAPFLLVLGVPAALVSRVWRRRRPAAVLPPEPGPEEPDED
ncbi:DUF4349 domain-containing protein [Kitasatospora sp. NPDC087314]|uniref:DUF4349 domain-containing protein n=1 Tax=Kitasatospora sp. NPDC087314 TaxID=3364068 RepID=UPI0038272708